ncbi:MAG: dATP/dGTP diphosphohydrolase domain-containing protein [Vicinamibacterales bacterium]
MNEQADKYIIKDSGQRESFAGGMVRDVATDKTNYALIADGPMLSRWAAHLTKGAKKYSARNWLLAQGAEELLRAQESAFRHFMQWYYGEQDEDHAAAVFFNINEAEYIKARHVPEQAP